MHVLGAFPRSMSVTRLLSQRNTACRLKNGKCFGVKFCSCLAAPEGKAPHSREPQIHIYFFFIHSIRSIQSFTQQIFIRHMFRIRRCEKDADKVEFPTIPSEQCGAPSNHLFQRLPHCYFRSLIVSYPRDLMRGLGGISHAS